MSNSLAFAVCVVLFVCWVVVIFSPFFRRPTEPLRSPPPPDAEPYATMAALLANHIAQGHGSLTPQSTASAQWSWWQKQMSVWCPDFARPDKTEVTVEDRHVYNIPQAQLAQITAAVQARHQEQLLRRAELLTQRLLSSEKDRKC